jgi:choline dehydrogenase-like flavoprotein
MTMAARIAVNGAFVDAAREGMPAVEPDFVIVGSGAGGSAAARVLAEAGASVVVLEEGPYVDPKTLGVSVGPSMARLFRAGGKQVAFGRATTPILQGRAVGGTTFVNSAIVWRLPEYVLERWHEQFGLGDALPARALDAAAARLEEEMSVRPVVEGVNAGKQDLLLRDGAKAVGIAARFIQRYERDCHGSGRCLHGCPYEAKQSTAVSILRRAVADGAVVVSRARVDGLERAGGRVVAVRGKVSGDGPETGRRFRLSARKAVIVAGGVIQSSNLMWRSGGGRPARGQHIKAHPATAVLWL